MANNIWPKNTNNSVYLILYFCIVFKYLYSASRQPWANGGALGSIRFKKRDKF